MGAKPLLMNLSRPCLILLALSLSGMSLSSCSSAQSAADNEILVALHPESARLLTDPAGPDPLHTGLPSIDSLNRKWQVQQMSRVFPDISPDDEAAVRQGLTGIFKLSVPARTDLQAMIQDYQSDPNVDYVELNKAFEVK